MPMICHWTMRFESKHSYFKHLANMMGNFTNVCYSLSLRHQLYQCYLNLNKDDLPAERTDWSRYNSCNAITCTKLSDIEIILAYKAIIWFK